MFQVELVFPMEHATNHQQREHFFHDPYLIEYVLFRVESQSAGI